LKITETKRLFTLLLFFSSTIFPLKIEEIIENGHSPENNTNINNKPRQPDSRPQSRKMGKSGRRTETKLPAWKAIDSSLDEPSMPPLFHNNNIRPGVPVKKDSSNTTKLPLVNKAPTDQQSKHSDTQNICHRLAKLNQKLLKSGGPPLL